MQLTRKQIIEFLQTNHYTTASELSSALNVTAANIRHHLGALKKQDLIDVFGKLPVKGRGRPTYLYRLSKNKLDHNLANLSDILFKSVFDSLSPLDIQGRMTQIAKKMVGEIYNPPNLFQRLNQSIIWFNERHYQARWEASPTGPRVLFGFCPYIAIIDSNPEICSLDLALISQLTSLPAEHVEKLERNPEGARQCVFLTIA